MRSKERCPRCNRNTLDRDDCGESAIYGSDHLICNECFVAEDSEIDLTGTNELPERLRSYGPSNRW